MYCCQLGYAHMTYLVSVPRGSGRASLALSISNHSHGNEIRLVHDTSVCYRQAVAQLTSFMDCTRRLGIDMRGERHACAGWKAESPDESFQTVFRHGILWIETCNASFEVEIGQERGCSVPRLKSE